MSLEHRLATLERSNRRWKLLTFGLLVAVALRRFVGRV